MENKLEIYYVGDESWTSFVRIWKGEMDRKLMDKMVVESCGQHNDIAIVISGIFENNAYSWLNQPVPALDNLKPIDCLNDSKLIKRLRVCLMRIPA